jgi:outer membrane protein assembly factor BamB
MKADYNLMFPPIRVKNPTITPPLEAILQKALQPEVRNRYSSVAEMRQQVLRDLTRAEAAALPARHMAQTAILSGEPAAPAPVKKSGSRARIVALASGIFMTGLAIVAAVIFVNDQLQTPVTSVESKATPPAVAPIVNLPVVPKVADWPLPGRDAGFTRYTPDAPPDVINVLWQTKAVGMTGELVAGEGKIVLNRTTKDVKVKEVVCFDAADGKILWQKKFTDGVRGTDNRATVKDGLVFFNGGDNVYCFDGASGDTLWKRSVMCYSSLLPLEGQVLLGSNEGVLCLDAATGQPAWQMRPDELRSLCQHIIIDKGNLIFSGHNVVFCADLDTHNIKWTYDEWDGKYGYLSALTGGGGKAYVLYSDAKPGVLVCLDSSTGEKLWQADVDVARNEWSCAPALAPGKLVLQGSSSISCYDAGTGKKLWFQQTSEKTDFNGVCNYSPPIIAGSTVISGIQINDYCVTAYRDLETGNIIKQMDQYFILPIVAYGKIYNFDSQSLSLRCHGE